MSDTFTCLSLEKLLKWIKREEKTDKIFGIPKALFFIPSHDDVFRMNRYGHLLETPVGVAAGPHTQLSQNIIAAWLTGARYIELKTVQVLDELEITKPCINMEDEGYNCEWSQELKLDRSFDEYLNALIAIHVLKKRLSIGDAKEPGFLFNMSVGYNLDGILSPSVQSFLDAMADAGDRIKEKLRVVKSAFPDTGDLVIPPVVSDNITISTMHGCPPEEIEKIGSYFIETRRLNTTVKLNPTLLGPDALRDILNNQLGFDVSVPDIAFEHDLKYDAGITLIGNLMKKAKKSGVAFNVKLTNTLETRNTQSKLPENEPMVYMSGRPLHVISINLAARLQEAFKGDLDISFSAGADCFNLSDILACGLKPVTVCSDLLKPGGYGRLSQYLTLTEQAFSKKGAVSISDYIKKKATGATEETAAALENLCAYAKTVLHRDQYHKKSFPWSTIKTKRQLHGFDCVSAPCKGTCPAGQDVPAYMHYTAQGMFKEAFDAILQTNPFPNVQGMVCDHPCTQKCTRINYDTPLQIREIKRFVARQNPGNSGLEPRPDNRLSAAVIGGGPSGFSAAYFLRMNGFSVDLFEAKKFPGGMAADAIPSFRLDDESIQKDIDRIIALGVKVHYGKLIDQDAFKTIKTSHDYVYISVGAARAYPLDIPGATVNGVFDQLGFLSDVRQGNPVRTGENIIIVGGGNSAVDAARTAGRLAGENGNVTILYRRSIKEMPADLEEINAAILEGINIQERVLPVSVKSENGTVTAVTCLKMTLGEPDASGRPRPVAIENSEFEIKTDTIISAIGQQVVIPFLDEKNFSVNPDTCQTKLEKVYAGGDAVRGASTLINAIADGQRAVKHMGMDAAITHPVFKAGPPYEQKISDLETNLAKRTHGPDLFETDLSQRNGFGLVIQTMTREMVIKEASRCMGCDTICDICTTVCPNRANLAYAAQPFHATTFKAIWADGVSTIEKNGSFMVTQPHQVINIGDFCNECGNCTGFCPTSGAPYKDKPKFYLERADFEKELSGYFMENGAIYKKSDGQTAVLKPGKNGYVFETDQVIATIDTDRFDVLATEFKEQENQEVDLADAAELGFLHASLKDIFCI